jgi:YceI-like domain
MKNFIFSLIALVIAFPAWSQIYTAKAGSTTIVFFSKSPLEDIEALNKGATVVLKASTNDVQVRITIQNFKFKNSLMEEHFNENYMETEKKVEVNGAATYPNRYAEFKGKINEKIDYAVDGETKVTVTGKLTMHGVTKDVTINGTVTKTGNDLKLSCVFKVMVKDYEIKVPSMYVKNIAEEIEITFNSVLEPFQKK